MITNSYSRQKGKISPEDFFPEREKVSDICLVIFSYKLVQKVFEEYHPEIVGTLNSSSAPISIYLLEYQGKKICFYNSPMGSALAASFMLEASYLTGAKKFIAFGTAGRLDKSIPPLAFIVPTSAYRDEGLSYHYAPPKDYIRIKNHATIEKFLKEEGLEFVKGKTWTTDAFYKETEKEIAARKKEGCISVDMECAGMQALADFYGFSFYEFFFGADLLDSQFWEHSVLGTSQDQERHQDIFLLALKLSLKI
ncbi:MAG: nucleoside phosphorylase [Bacilli bacterium]|jgi:uridine phosphorylase|nr:nucleoside phosphorylase [Bacilli bacterium]